MSKPLRPLRPRSIAHPLRAALLAGLGAGLAAGCAGGPLAGAGQAADAPDATQPVVAVTSDAPTTTPAPTADPDGAVALTWDELNALDLETGFAPPELADLDGQRVRVPGFMVPLEDSAESVSEFLLVPFVGACVHVPPPPANQMVHVLMNDGATTQVYWWDPIWIYGTLHIENVEHFYGQSSYRLEGERVVLYTPGS